MAVPIRHLLEAMGHKQPPTPLKTDNSTAYGFTYDNINKKGANHGMYTTTGYIVDNTKVNLIFIGKEVHLIIWTITQNTIQPYIIEKLDQCM